MSETAFSRSFGRELDFKQLLKLRGVIASLDQPALGLTPDERAWMRQDLLCPSCRCDGAVAVLSDPPASKGRNTRQPHFRFQNGLGRTAHKIGCDFYRLDDEPGLARGVDVLYAADDRDTRLIRGLVCKAMAIGVVGRSDIFAMRTWFLEVRDAQSFTVTGDPAMADWLYGANRIQAYTPLAFEPFHVGLPGFDAHEAARRHQAFVYRDFAKHIPRVGFTAAVRDRVRRLLSVHKDQSLIAIGVLRDKFEQALCMARLMVEYGALKLSKGRPAGYLGADTPVSLIAFAAVLLFVSDWSIEVALGKFARIVAAPAPEDQTLGNVIGLNPFHDFSAIEIVRFISSIPPQPGRTYDFEAELADALARIQSVVATAPPR